MRPGPGDLAYCVVPLGYDRFFDKRFCTIKAGGVDDLSKAFVPLPEDSNLLFCEWCRPVRCGHVLVRGCWMAASWLRKVGGPGADLTETDSAPVLREAVLV